MRKLTSTFFSLIIVAVLLVVIEQASAINPPSQPVFVQEYLGQNTFIEGRLSDLLGAMSQEQMSWAPAEGVRTCGQIYLHVTEANHMLAGFMSGAEMEGERGAMEKSTTDKDEIVQMLKDSFAAVNEAAGKLTEEDLNKMVQTPFGMEMSMRNFMISLLNHSHEHLGQGIAYGRMNGVTPPWSQKQEGEG
ncbi:MAG: DinB family protein [Ignavibacteria bacterium]|nr:DinB family protein [Ignavibacteria bacterium]